MSSWANRGIPRKRDISQIPESMRPQIVPRVARSEILASESYQEVSQNEIIIKSSKNDVSKKNKDDSVNPRQYVNKKINNILNSSAIELKYKEKSYVFVILRNLRTVIDNDLWISSYNSIRQYYTNKIIIIDDNSSINTVDGKLYNTDIIRSEFNGAGEILPYYYFLKNKWADRMIVLHDSMFINRLFRDNELEDNVKFHWHFDASKITNTNKVNLYLSLLKNNEGVIINYKNSGSNGKNEWNGCFGGASVIDYDIIEFLETKYNLFTILTLSIKTRNDRELFERIFGIILYYEKLINTTNCSNFGLITEYPGAFESQNNNYDTAKHIISQKGYDTAILKVWRGR